MSDLPPGGGQQHHEGQRYEDLCRIRVRFDSPRVDFAYVDDRVVAQHFAAAAGRLGAVVTLDECVERDLPPLPCRRLWA